MWTYGTDYKMDIFTSDKNNNRTDLPGMHNLKLKTLLLLGSYILLNINLITS